MIVIADHILARILAVEVDDVRALKAACRETHPKGGMQLGHCACGRPGPPSSACRALGALMDVADLMNRETKP